MSELLRMLITVISSKILSLTTKLKLWTNGQYIRARITEAIKRFFSKTLSVRPRDKKDYYTVFHWLVSKRLVFAILTIAGVLSLAYLMFRIPESALGKIGGVKVYAYHSIPLRFKQEKVKIKAKSGYIAYEGDVSQGKANGNGKLYNPARQLVYDGAFEDSLYEGSGILYRKSGSKEYEGEFHLGLKEGSGKLFDPAASQIFEGNFTRDEIRYTDLLGKSTAEMAAIYTGRQTIYTMKEEFAVDMEEISAIYCGSQSQGALDDSVMIEEIYVIDSAAVIEGKKCSTAAELKEVYDNCAYEGNSQITLSEAVAIEKARQQRSELSAVHLVTENIYTDVQQVNSYDEEYYCYLYTFIKDEIIYTYFFQDKNEAFFLYLIQADGS